MCCVSESRLGRPKALTAVSRELTGFVWALGRQVAEAEVPRREPQAGAARGRGRQSQREPSATAIDTQLAIPTRGSSVTIHSAGRALRRLIPAP
jgi:hypothetical protein